jgi:hypothetical protein
MTAAQEMAKDHDEKSLARRAVTDAWGRSWKADLILRLKEEHETQSAAVLRYTQALPSVVEDENDERAVRCAKLAQDMLVRTRDLMLRLALHPTPPKALSQSKPGAGRRKDPITEATLVSVDGAAPDAQPAPEPDPEA